jgi:hypothetical protein
MGGLNTLPNLTRFVADTVGERANAGGLGGFAAAAIERGAFGLRERRRARARRPGKKTRQEVEGDSPLPSTIDI